MTAKFVLFKDIRGEYRFHLKANNGKKILQSEGYKLKSSAMKTIKLIKRIVGKAKIVDETK